MNHTYHMAKNEMGTECMVVLLQDGRNGSVCPAPRAELQAEWANMIAEEIERVESLPENNHK